MRVTAGRILVIGLGRSGRSAVEYLLMLRDDGAPIEVHAADGADTEALDELARDYVARGVTVQLGADDVEGAWDLVVVSPGVPPGSELFKSAVASGAPVVSEIELAYGHSAAPFVAVTGTNGKTTTTSLIAHLLQTAGIEAETVGNIDPPALSIAPSASPDTVMVCEASSFQLAQIRDFHPVASVLLNVTPDHLDWHGSLEQYRADKGRVFENQGAGDLAVIVVDDPGAASFVEQVEACGVRVCQVTTEGMPPGGAGLEDGVLTVAGPDGAVALVHRNELLIAGDHNVLNALAASAVALDRGADPAMVSMGLRSFAPIEHRLQPVGVQGEVEYVNDSKATNPDAVIKALSAFADRSVVLLLGGRNKGNSFTELATMLPERARAVVVFGEAASQIADDLVGSVETLSAEDLSDAVERARHVALAGDVILLSPGCASFDEFTDYEARGRAFATLATGEVGRDG